MRKTRYIILGFSITYLVIFPLSAQLNDFGTAGSVSLSKSINRFLDVSVEQELRFHQVSTSLSRSATSIGADFDLVSKILRAEIDYDFLYRRNNDNFYELRHRTSFGFLVRKKFDRFNYRFRTRIQSTYRDERRGDYKYNPRIVWRNKLELRYDIFGSPLTPYINGELFCPLNSVNGVYLNGYRISFGTNYRLTKRSELDFKIFLDQELQQAFPENILYCCLGWNYNL